ncbi:hypothetical protein, partial [Bacillus cereus]|uniref:hypothetical protein n=1 Tax=Bacillus cereus TaxID=1396 RepID=UPI001A7E9344
TGGLIGKRRPMDRLFVAKSTQRTMGVNCIFSHIITGRYRERNRLSQQFSKNIHFRRFIYIFDYYFINQVREGV